MSRYSVRAITRYLSEARDGSLSSTDRGRALEELVSHIFSAIPGVSVLASNALDVFECQELDVVLQNDSSISGLVGFDAEILVECKNWSNPVGSSEVAWLDTKLRCRGLRHGFLVTMNGITGQPHSLKSAHQIVASALAEQRRIVVLDGNILGGLRTHTELVTLCRQRMGQLLTSRGIG